jgi:hypothetical protein
MFGTEINIHIPGTKNLDQPAVFVFPKVLVCLSCGLAEFTLLENELQRLAQTTEA